MRLIVRAVVQTWPYVNNVTEAHALGRVGSGSANAAGKVPGLGQGTEGERPGTRRPRPSPGRVFPAAEVISAALGGVPSSLRYSRPRLSVVGCSSLGVFEGSSRGGRRGLGSSGSLANIRQMLVSEESHVLLCPAEVPAGAVGALVGTRASWVRRGKREFRHEALGTQTPSFSEPWISGLKGAMRVI